MAKRKDYIDDFKNDVLFKYCMNDDQDPDCLYLLNLIISKITHIKCKSIKVTNPEINPKHVTDKDMLLDLHVVDENNKKINIEMQNSTLTKNQHQRFQVYGASLIATQQKVGNDYVKDMKEVHQIIFVDDVDKNDMRLIDHYTSKNQNGKEEKYNLINRFIVYLPYINEIVKNKGIENLSELEKAIYIFKNGISNDIIEMKDRVINIMNKKMTSFNEDEVLRDAAYKRALNKNANEKDKQDMYNQGKEEGQVEKQKENVLKMFHFTYPKEDDKFLQNLTSEQYDIIHEMLFTRKTIEDIKEYLNKKEDS